MKKSNRKGFTLVELVVGCGVETPLAGQTAIIAMHGLADHPEIRPRGSAYSGKFAKKVRWQRVGRVDPLRLRTLASDESSGSQRR